MSDVFVFTVNSLRSKQDLGVAPAPVSSERAGTLSKVTAGSSCRGASATQKIPIRKAAVGGVRKPGGGASKGTAFGRICVKENPVTSKGGLLAGDEGQRAKRGGSGDTRLLPIILRGRSRRVLCVSPPRSPHPLGMPLWVVVPGRGGTTRLCPPLPWLPAHRG